MDVLGSFFHSFSSSLQLFVSPTHSSPLASETKYKNTLIIIKA